MVLILVLSTLTNVGFIAHTPDTDAQVDNMLRWLLANYQTSWEWILLRSQRVSRKERTLRLRHIVDRCHAFGIECGVVSRQYALPLHYLSNDDILLAKLLYLLI
jgi:hypothetical protein